MALTEVAPGGAATHEADPSVVHRAGVGEEPTTRDRLIAAAIEVFWERGYEGAGVQEIARRAGLTTGAIYGNFRGKADLLFAAIGTRGQAELDELFTARLAAGGAARLLADMGSHLLDQPANGRASGRVGLLLDAFVAARRDPEMAAQVQELVAGRRANLAGVVELARASGDVADDVDTDAMAAFALVLTLGSLLFTELGIPRPDGDEWSALITRFVGALSPSQSHDPSSKENRPA